MTSAPVALITGARRGIGRAIGEALATLGFEIVDMSRPRTATTAGADDPADSPLPQAGRWLTIEADVSDVASHAAVISQVAAVFGRLDMFVSNAGVAPEQRLDVLETTPASFDRVMGINLRGAFFLAQRAAQYMLSYKSTCPDARPRVVLIGSISAQASSPNRAEYCISKAGLSMVARVLADRLAADGIPVFEVRPGVVRTRMTAPVQDRYDAAIANGLVPQRRCGEPEDVARVVAALARGDFDYATGTIVDVGGGLHIPRL